MTTEEKAVTAGANAPGWKSAIPLGALVGLGGLLMIGVVGGLVGLVAGMAAARGPRAVLALAVVALLATVALTLLEQPLSESEIAGFPEGHPLADVAGAIAAVLLLAGLAGVLAHRDATSSPRVHAEEPDGGGPLPPISTIASVLGAALLGLIALWRLGDRSWDVAAVAVGIPLLVLAVAILLAPRLRSGQRVGSP